MCLSYRVNCCAHALVFQSCQEIHDLNLLLNCFFFPNDHRSLRYQSGLEDVANGVCLLFGLLAMMMLPVVNKL